MQIKNTADWVHLSIGSNTLGIFQHSEQLTFKRIYSVEMSGHTKHFIKTYATLFGLILFSPTTPAMQKNEGLFLWNGKYDFARWIITSSVMWSTKVSGSQPTQKWQRHWIHSLCNLKKKLKWYSTKSIYWVENTQPLLTIKVTVKKVVVLSFK